MAIVAKRSLNEKTHRERSVFIFIFLSESAGTFGILTQSGAHNQKTAASGDGAMHIEEDQGQRRRGVTENIVENGGETHMNTMVAAVAGTMLF